jgi:uncharacterized BrkB/YihY/UPF0761 family membrane protein
MDSGNPGEDPSAPAASRRARLEACVEAARALRERLEARVVERRRGRGPVDALAEIVDRDLEVGGGIMAGALAYRLFVWLLPLALVVVGGLGIVSQAADSTPSDAASSFGVSGLVSSSVANAARSGARVYALLIGVPLLMIATRSVLRTLIVTHRLAWVDMRSRTHKPTWVASARLLVALVSYFVIAGVSHRVDPLLGPVPVLLTIVLMVPYAGLWLAVSVDLPRRDAPWQALVPGAVLFAVGVELLHVVTEFYIAPHTASLEGTYGSLGIAAALLLSLFLISRLAVGAAIVNATLWDRRTRSVARRSRRSPG